MTTLTSSPAEVKPDQDLQRIEAHIDGLVEYLEKIDLDSWDEGDENSMAYFLDNALDVEYAISAQGDFRGVKVMVEFGGPNSVIDTADGIVRCCWGARSAERGIPGELVEALDDYFYDAVASLIWR